MKDFFISYNSADKAWAEWLAWVLEENGYTVIIQAWDFRPGGNFIIDMQRAADESTRTIMVLSEVYLQAKYTQPEWAAAFKQDPESQEHRLIPIRVAPCQPTGMLAPLVYVDLVGKSEADAEASVLASLQNRAKPATRPSFPGKTPGEERVVKKKVPFPPGRSIRVTWQLVLDYQLENTFFDHGRDIDRVVDRLKQLSGDQRLEDVDRVCKNGSTFLTLKGTEEGLRKLQALSETGQLAEINGIQVEQINLPPDSSQTPPITQNPPMTNESTTLTPRERLALNRKITGLTTQSFNELLLLLEPPDGIVPPPTAPQGDRTYALLSWARSTTGCGLAAVRDAFNEIAPSP
ncbi:sulfatase-modifying factor domain protein [Halomicronema hongdechloris C2206]|uniref:Sulfatase-modifying factor domain protein n=1 Tax=Halomicronema hongdechloris C2206 TaxID=1641165 RepID=A0A1Z3HR56_9CYAN|nr:toll/interleukin-1 receptor domain-containing protein [Halomicronema hongdechloris]ASC72736.1 sulfatase-modifying factor domain protein [Halomicronema hongdechloris C2206]